MAKSYKAKAFGPSPQVKVRLMGAHNEVERIAKRESRSMSQMVRMLVLEAINARRKKQGRSGR